MNSVLLQLIQSIQASNPLQSNYLAGCYEQLTPRERNKCEEYLAGLLNRGISLPYLTECYNTIVEDTKREQTFFMRHKRYRYSSYQEVSSSVYLNEGYMERYMYGLAITSFLWPIHIAMNRFFSAHLPRDRAGNYLEVGPGHGLHFTSALALCRFDAFHAVDISPKSAALTRELVAATGASRGKNYSIMTGDFLNAELPGKPYQAVVMGEVIEHVEHPEKFLQRAFELTVPDAFIYVTTVINAPAIDHIYLLRNELEFEELLHQAGMKCDHRLVVPYAGRTIQECIEHALPMNVGAVLKKL